MQRTAEQEAVRQKIITALGPKFIEDTQKDIDAMKKMSQYKQYIKQRKLELISGESGRFLDNLLKLEIIK